MILIHFSSSHIGKLQMFRAVLSNMVTTNQEELFKYKLIRIK